MKITHATASRIKTYKDCAFKFFLEYHIQYPPMRVGNIYAEKGSAVHLALERYVNALLGKTENAEIDWEKTLREYYKDTQLWKLDNRAPGKGYAHPVVKTCFGCPYATTDSKCTIAAIPYDAVEGCPRPNFADDVELIRKTLVRKDCDLFELDTQGKLKKKILCTEREFEMNLTGVPVKGFMDLIVEEDSETLEVVDYKTGRPMSYEKMRNDPQVRIYAAVARILYPQYKNIMVTLYYLKKAPLSHMFDLEDDLLTCESLQNAFKEIANNKNPNRRENYLCNYCVGWDNCGVIREKFVVNGRFRLPTIDCASRKDGEPCWGSIYPEETQRVAIHNVSEIIYVCKGHAEIHRGGIYKKEVVELAKEPNDLLEAL